MEQVTGIEFNETGIPVVDGGFYYCTPDFDDMSKVEVGQWGFRKRPGLCDLVEPTPLATLEWRNLAIEVVPTWQGAGASVWSGAAPSTEAQVEERLRFYQALSEACEALRILNSEEAEQAEAEARMEMQ